MSRFDHFLDSLLAALVVALVAASVKVAWCLVPYLPLGSFAPCFLFGSGALVGCCLTYYFCNRNADPRE